MSQSVAPAESEISELLHVLNDLELLVEQSSGLMGMKAIPAHLIPPLLARLRQALPEELFAVDEVRKQQERMIVEVQEQAQNLREQAQNEAMRIQDLARRQANQCIEQAEAQRQRLLAEAERQAQAITVERTQQSTQLVQRHPIVIRARQSSQEFCQAAQQDADRQCQGADEYAIEVLEKAEAAFNKLNRRVREGQTLSRPAIGKELL